MIGGQNLLGMEQLGREQINAILSTAQGFLQVSRRTIKKVPSLRGRTIITMFYEASTRTRMSFELAGKRLSADTVNISVSTSSVSKGESLHDTVMTLNAMQPDAVIVRHPASGAPGFIADRIDARVLNAGDGQHEHPSQALLDMLTMRQRFGKLEGLNVSIIGDIAHSRVARSNLMGLATMGANVRVAAPKTLLPRGLIDAYPCTVCHSVAEAIEGADVVMALRLQRERMEGAYLPSMREYAIEYGISTQMLEHSSPEAILMHPGPVNRGVELTPEVIDGPRSVILDQVENGVAVRMALLYLILGGEPA